MRLKAWYWILDYVYVLKRQLVSIVPRKKSAYRRPGAAGVLILPGVYENWRFIQPVAKYLYVIGYDVHVVDTVGYNRGKVEDMAVLVKAYIEHNELSGVTIVAHSKGGLVGKLVMSMVEVPGTVRGLVAINAPFSGSKYARILPFRSLRIFIPDSLLLNQLAKLVAPNRRIVSIYGMFDPHIPGGSLLEGAVNVQVASSFGHFRILENKDVLNEIANGIRHIRAMED